MLKIKSFKSMPALARAFVILAALFFLIGFGTLGSFQGTGASAGMQSGATVVFRLEKQDGQSKLNNIYIHLSNAYVEVGQKVTVRFRRASSVTSNDTNWYSSYLGEKKIASYVSEDEKVTLTTGEWLDLYDLSKVGGYNLTSYPYYEFTASAALVDEIVFIADNGTVIPATVSADYTTGISKENAEKLVDAQRVPNTAQSSFFRFTTEEKFAMATVQEIRQGNTYNAANKYVFDGVYNSLGYDILTLGTLIFGTSAFGLRFFSFAASFGCLIVGYLLTKKVTHSEKAAFAFGLLFMLGGYPVAYGHLGTPLMIAVFFVVFSLYQMHKFYSEGFQTANVKGATPILLSGLSFSCAIATNGATLIPLLGVVLLFVLGMIRQKKAKTYALSKAEALDAEEGTLPQVSEVSETSEVGQEEGEEVERKISHTAKALAEYRYKNVVALDLFIGLALVGTLVICLLSFLPASYTLAKAYGHNSTLFALMWKSFAAGFVGGNLPVTASGWDPFYLLFAGSGETYAKTVGIVNIVGAVAGIVGIVYCIAQALSVLCKKQSGKQARLLLRSTLLPVTMTVLCLVTAAFAPTPLFVAAAYTFSFMAAGTTVGRLPENKAVKGLEIAYIVLLVLFFAISVPFLFSIPLPEAFISAIF